MQPSQLRQPSSGPLAPVRPRVLSRSWPALAVAGLLVGCSEPRPRNLIIVCLDTFRLERSSAFGADRTTTPRLAELAARGTTFTEVQSTSNWTVPAVASLFTGLLPAGHGAVVPGKTKNLGVAPEAPNPPGANRPMLAEILSAAGFETKIVSGNPYLYGRFQSGFRSVRVRREDGAEQIEEIARWLEGLRSERFFLYWQIMDLHQPLDPPPEAAARYLPDPPSDFPTPMHRNWGFAHTTSDSDPGFPVYRDLKLALYDGTMWHVDQLLGRLFDSLAGSGLADSTLVLLTADHGEEFWDHAQVESAWRDDPRGHWGIGHGHTMFQELLRVPLIAVGPRVEPDRRIECAISLADVFPTALSALGVSTPAALDGRDYASTLSGSKMPCPSRPLVSQAPAYGPESSAIRIGRFKLIRREGQAPLLFDLSTDEKETNDLAAGKPKIAAEMAHTLEQLGADIARIEPAAAADLEERLLQDLRALGYLP